LPIAFKIILIIFHRKKIFLVKCGDIKARTYCITKISEFQLKSRRSTFFLIFSQTLGLEAEVGVELVFIY
jgi:hypothetical protein